MNGHQAACEALSLIASWPQERAETDPPLADRMREAASDALKAIHERRQVTNEDAAQMAFDSFMANRDTSFWKDAIFGTHPHEFWFAAWDAAMRHKALSEFERDFPPMGGLTECDMGDSHE